MRDLVSFGKLLAHSHVANSLSYRIRGIAQIGVTAIVNDERMVDLPS
jgi:hypothetical protein